MAPDWRGPTVCELTPGEDGTRVPCTAGRFSTRGPPGKPVLPEGAGSRKPASPGGLVKPPGLDSLSLSSILRKTPGTAPAKPPGWPRRRPSCCSGHLPQRALQPTPPPLQQGRVTGGSRGGQSGRTGRGSHRGGPACSGAGEPRHRARKPEHRKRAGDPQFWSQSLVVKSAGGDSKATHRPVPSGRGSGAPGRSGESRARTELPGRTWGGTGPQTAGLSGRDCLQLQLQAGPWRPALASPHAPARDRAGF